jgi:hypothetical protein
MRISIDGNSYELTSETQTQLLQQLQAFEVDAYHHLDEALRFLLKPVARHLLEKTEKKLRASGVGKEEAARICRPVKREDPVIRFIGLNMAISQSLFNNAELSIETRGATITSATLQAADEGRGSLALNGDQRERENNGAEIPGRGLYEALSIE